MSCKYCGKETIIGVEVCEDCQKARSKSSTSEESSTAVTVDECEKSAVFSKNPSGEEPEDGNAETSEDNECTECVAENTEDVSDGDNTFTDKSSEREPTLEIGDDAESGTQEGTDNAPECVTDEDDDGSCAAGADKKSEKNKSKKAVAAVSAAVLAVLMLLGIAVSVIPKLTGNDAAPGKEVISGTLTDNAGEADKKENSGDTTEESSGEVQEEEAELRVLEPNEIAEFSKSVMMLEVYDSEGNLTGTGSGFIVGDSYTLITNYHVIEDASKVRATAEDNSIFNFSGVTYFDAENDIAILRFKKSTELPPIKIADSDEVRVGDRVYAIGSPLSLKNTLSDGLVSAIREDKDGHTDIQTTAPISPGSSGGVLLDRYGRAIGITYASYVNGQNINLAIPSALFADKLYGETVYSLDEVMLKSRPMGNTVSNYNSGARLVEYGDIIFHNYNTEYKIMKYDKEMGEDVSIGRSGKYLNAINDKLYFVSEADPQKVYEYDISTEKFRKFYTSTDGNIKMMYATRHGLILDIGKNSRILRIDFDGNKKDRLTGFKNVRLWNDSLLICSDSEFGATEKGGNPWKFTAVSVKDFSDRTPVELDDTFFANGIYAIGKQSVYSLISESFIIVHDPVEGTYDYAEPNGWKKRRCNIIVNGSELYYYKTKGTVKLSFGDGEKEERFTHLYYYDTLSFTEDGDVYGIWNKSMFADEDYDNWQYLCMNKDGDVLRELDKGRPNS